MIQFSKTEEYAVLLLNALTEAYNKRLVPLSEVAREYHIPLLFLRNIANKLKHGNVIDAVEGKAGGYKLAKPPHKLTLGDVLRVFTDKPLLASCADGKHECVCGKQNVCQTGSAWRRVNQEFLERVASISLGDFVHESERKAH